MDLVSLRGRSALSPFRVAKLLAALSAASPSHRVASLTATYWHFAQVSRSQSVLELATVQPVDPNVQVAVFASPLGRDRYTLMERRRTEAGASTTTGSRTGG